MILLLANSSKKESYSFDLRRCISEHPSISDLNSILQNSPNSGVELLRPVFNRDDFKKKTFTFSNDEYTEVLDRIAARADFLLDPKKEIAQGLVTPQDGLNKKTAEIIGGGAEIGEGVFILTNDELKSLALSQEEKKLIKPFFTTKELHRYAGVLQNEYWVIYTDSSFKATDSMARFPKLKSHLDRFESIITSDNRPYGLHRARDERFFLGRKIVSVRKCDRPTFTIVDVPCYVSQTFNVIKSDRIDLGYLCALLNSTVCAFWLRKKGKMQGSNYQIDKEPLVGIPIYFANEEVQRAISFVVGILVECDRLGLTIESEKLDRLLDLLIFNLYFPSEGSQLEPSLVAKFKELNAKFGTDTHSITLESLPLLVESIFSNHDITSNSQKLSSTELFQLMVSSLK
jgi:adenine-specific DNA-methyltransferase